MTQEQILADAQRALRECFPERADAVFREIESRFAEPKAIRDEDGKRVEIRLQGTGPYAWPDRTGWGLSFEFLRAMRRLQDEGFKGDVRVTIVAARE